MKQIENLPELIEYSMSKFGGAVVLIDFYRLMVTTTDKQVIYILEYSNHSKDGLIADLKIDHITKYNYIREEEVQC